MITVVGSLNMDLLIEAPRLPAPGETVCGHQFRREPGGKGANQACTAARMGAPVTMIGAVGTDPFGDELLEQLRANHVDVLPVIRRNQCPTGTAMIITDAQGQNQIVIAAGANGTLQPEDVNRWATSIQEARALLTQLEIPLPAVEAALSLAREAGVLTLLNPAPFLSLPKTLLQKCDWLLPNEIEAEQLTGIPVKSEADAQRAAHLLQEQTGGGNVVITLGPRGVWLETKSFSGHVPAPAVAAIDTVAAGDTFVGAFAAELIQGTPPQRAATFACAAAALSVTRRGAQTSIPTRKEVEAFLGT